jgi:Zn-dependent protease with chaperone function
MKAAHRKRTDTFCTIVAVVLALFMFIASLLMWNKSTEFKNRRKLLKTLLF